MFVVFFHWIFYWVRTSISVITFVVLANCLPNLTFLYLDFTTFSTIAPVKSKTVIFDNCFCGFLFLPMYDIPIDIHFKAALLPVLDYYMSQKDLKFINCQFDNLLMSTWKMHVLLIPWEYFFSVDEPVDESF